MSNYTRNKQTKSEEQGIDLREIFQRIKQSWYLFVICPLLFLGFAWLYAQTQVPTYEVKSTILMKDEKSNHGVTASDLIAKELDLGGDKKILTDESKIMTSSYFHMLIDTVPKFVGFISLYSNRTVSLSFNKANH